MVRLTAICGNRSGWGRPRRNCFLPTGRCARAPPRWLGLGHAAAATGKSCGRDCLRACGRPEHFGQGSAKADDDDCHHAGCCACGESSDRGILLRVVQHDHASVWKPATTNSSKSRAEPWCSARLMLHRVRLAGEPSRAHPKGLPLRTKDGPICTDEGGRESWLPPSCAPRNSAGRPTPSRPFVAGAHSRLGPAPWSGSHSLSTPCTSP